MQLFYQPNIQKGDLFLLEEESKHCIKVLRHQVGDSLHVVDGTGAMFLVRITDAHPKKTCFALIDHKRKEERPYRIHIAIAPTKQVDRIEWFVEKAVEIGIDEISFFFGRHSERKQLNLDRINKKAVAAMKQSLSYYLPSINLYQDLESLVSHIPTQQHNYIAYVDFDNPILLQHAAQPKQNTLVLIGPEGDFNEEELEMALEKGFIKVSLGANRLRTETAGIVACHTLHILNNLT